MVYQERVWQNHYLWVVGEVILEEQRGVVYQQLSNMFEKSPSFCHRCPAAFSCQNGEARPGSPTATLLFMQSHTIPMIVLRSGTPSILSRSILGWLSDIISQHDSLFLFQLQPAAGLPKSATREPKAIRHTKH
jgi:hypothetical protein